MEKLIKEYLEIQEELKKNYGIISVKQTTLITDINEVHVVSLEQLHKIADGDRVYVSKRDCEEYPYEAHFTKSNVKYFALLEEGENDGN